MYNFMCALVPRAKKRQNLINQVLRNPAGYYCGPEDGPDGPCVLNQNVSCVYDPVYQWTICTCDDPNLVNKIFIRVSLCTLDIL